MTELASASTRIQPAGKWSPEDERRLWQVMQKIADDLTEKSQLLRSLFSETSAEGSCIHPVLL
jgi:hypothetical protein